jgi:signal transduction histidine kinase/ligand-binding sensor domain-containing protein
MFLRIALVFCGYFLSFFPVAGQYNFFHLTTENGLNSSNVRCIVQDYQDFVWIGTEDGLHRYDGNSLVAYKHNPDDSTSLSSNFVLSLYEDSKHNLWVGTLDGGLLWYDRQKDCFHRFGNKQKNSFLGNTITSIYEDAKNFLLVGTEEGYINYFSIPANAVDEVKVSQLPLPKTAVNTKWNNAITPMALDKNGNLWVSYHGNGVYKVDVNKNAIYSYLPKKIPGRIFCMKVDSQYRLWIGTWDDGLYVVSLYSNNITHFKADGTENSLLHNYVTKIEEDLDGNVWVGTDEGINIFENSGDPFENPIIVSLRNDEDDKRSLLSNPVKAIATDKDGRVWVGTYYGGVNIYDKNAPDFITIRKNKPGSLSHNNVTGILADASNKIWIGTDGGGLNYAHGVKDLMANNLVKITLRNEVFGYNEKKVKCLADDALGNLWVGTWGGGIYRVNTKTLQTNHYSKASTRLNIPSNEIVSVTCDSKNKLWVGTFGAGLFTINPANNEVTQYPFLQRDGTYGNFDNVTVVFMDNAGKIWVAREGSGLSHFDSKTNSFIPVNIPELSSSLTILSMYQDPEGIFWLGTNSTGLIRFDEQKNTAEKFSENDGIANAVIHGICIGKDNKLWFSTNKGISCFDRENKLFENYSKKQGLQDNQFNNNSCFNSDNGMLFFGGIGGLNAFDPRAIKAYSPVSKLVFTGFWVHNAPYSVNNGGLPKNIVLIDTIELDHKQNNLSIEFSAVDHNFAADRKYAFLLENFDTEWQNINRERKATFTNLPPGKYTFRIKSSDKEKRWIESEKTLHIFIHPAWWQTWFFKISFIVLVTAIAYFSIRWRFKYLENQKRTLEEIVSLRTQELKQKNDELGVMVQEITKQNEQLTKNRMEIAHMNQEIKAQNENLKGQNDKIMLQQEELESAQEKLKFTNDKLEKLVEGRTKKLKATIRQLDKTVFELDRFVYSASHDLSAPLKSILGLIGLARMENEISRLHEYHEYIESSILKLELVIQSLVAYSRNAHMVLEIQPVHPKQLVHEVIQELRYMPESSGVLFQNNVKSDLAVSTDPGRLKLVLQNLISNAIKYSDPEKKKKIVSIDAKEGDEIIQILITDNGIGIDTESIPKIFSMYYRATEKSKGSGLGLFIVKEAVHKIQGKVSVESTLNLGSTFTIELPMHIKELVSAQLGEH